MNFDISEDLEASKAKEAKNDGVADKESNHNDSDVDSDSSSKRRSKTLTRTRSLLQGDMDLINRYAIKYGSKFGGSNSALNRQASGLPVHSPSPSLVSSPQPNQPQQPPQQRRKPSNLVSSSSAHQWGVDALSEEHSQMVNAMNSMISQQSVVLDRKKRILDMVEEASNDSSNPDFGKLERADDWDVLEVCWWLSSIHLDKYLETFHSLTVDGSILLRDLDETVLLKEIGIKRLHVRKMMREIQKLRDLSPKFKKMKQDENNNPQLQSLKAEIEALKKENHHLREENKKLRLLVQAK